MLLGVDVLYVEQYQVGTLHKALELREEGLLASERLGCGVETGVYASAMGLLEEVDKEIYLQQSLASAYGYAAIGAPVAAVALGLVEQLAGGSCCAAGIRTKLPSVRVVAVATAHTATLQEYKEPNPWPVYRAKGFG